MSSLLLSLSISRSLVPLHQSFQYFSHPFTVPSSSSLMFFLPSSISFSLYPVFSLFLSYSYSFPYCTSSNSFYYFSHYSTLSSSSSLISSSSFFYLYLSVSSSLSISYLNLLFPLFHFIKQLFLSVSCLFSISILIYFPYFTSLKCSVFLSLFQSFLAFLSNVPSSFISILPYRVFSLSLSYSTSSPIPFSISLTSYFLVSSLSLITERYLEKISLVIFPATSSFQSVLSVFLSSQPLPHRSYYRVC